MSNGLPNECLLQDFQSNGALVEPVFTTQMGKCYIELKTKARDEYEEAAEEKYKKKYEEKEKTLYSGTSVATGSIGAGAGGLACGLGLFPCLVKLVSKFR